MIIQPDFAVAKDPPEGFVESLKALLANKPLREKIKTARRTTKLVQAGKQTSPITVHISSEKQA